MSFNAQLVDQWVEGIVERLSDRLRDEVGVRNDPDRLKSAAFIFLAAKTLLDLDDDEVIDGIVDGGGDFGVDAIYFSTPENGEFLITLFQGKYKRDLDGDGGFPENGVSKTIDAIRILLNPYVQFSANKRLTSHVEEIRSMIREGEIPQVRVIFANNGRKWNQSCQQRLEGSKFGPAVTWEYAGPDEIVILKRKVKTVDTKVKLSGKAIVEDYPYMRAMIGRMSVTELARLFNENGDVLLERNIRRYLGLSGRVNEDIAATLRDAEQRQKFYFYNNGITIICSKFSYNAFSDKDWIVQVSKLQIVNGGQTSKTIQHIEKELGSEISDAQVLIRLYELPDDDEELVRRITQATNSQSPVDLRDLRSNDERQQRLALSIQELGYTYRSKRSESAVQSDEITSATAAEAVLAVWRRRPHQARFMSSEYFGKLYGVIFDDTLNGAQVVIAVLLLRIAENHRKRPADDAPPFLQYGSRYVAMMMGKFLLDDLGAPLKKFDHRRFEDARRLLESKAGAYFVEALQAIEQALHKLHQGQDISLQKLSATFRRYDLVEELLLPE